MTCKNIYATLHISQGLSLPSLKTPHLCVNEQHYVRLSNLLSYQSSYYMYLVLGIGSCKRALLVVREASAHFSGALTKEKGFIARYASSCGCVALHGPRSCFCFAAQCESHSKEKIHSEKISPYPQWKSYSEQSRAEIDQCLRTAQWYLDSRPGRPYERHFSSPSEALCSRNSASHNLHSSK